MSSSQTNSNANVENTNLFEQERIARTQNDPNLFSIQLQIISNCSNEDEIISTIKILQNKRKQNPEAIRLIIKKVFENNKNIEFLIKLLNEVIAGRMELENERIEIAEYIALNSQKAFAYEVIKNIPVETFTSVNESKKNEFLFRQFDLAIDRKEFVDSELFLRKFRRSYMNKEENMKWIERSIQLKIILKEYLAVSQLFLEMDELNNEMNFIELGSAYTILSSSLTENTKLQNTKLQDSKFQDSNDKFKFLKIFSEHKRNSEKMREIVNLFLSNSIIPFSMLSDFSSFDETDIQNAIIEHNFYVISKIFTKISVSDFSKIIQISENKAVEFISKMVNAKHSSAKINQCNGIIDFGESHIQNNSVNKSLDGIIDAVNRIEVEGIN